MQGKIFLLLIIIVGGKISMKIVLQDGISDCGICCLLSIIKYYNGSVSKEYLREITNTTKNGVTAFNLLEASKKLGFEALALNGEIERIDANNLPCIAHVIINKNYKHFVVIYDISYEKEKIVIMDPAKGKTTLSFSEFKLISSNNYIFLKPNNKLPVFNYTKIIKKTVYDYIYNEKKYIFFLLLLTVFYFFLNVIATFHFKYLIDYCINYNVSNNLLLISFIVLFIFILKEISQFLRKIIILKYSQMFDQKITLKTYKQLILLPYLYYKNRTTGEVVSRIKDLNVVKEYITTLLLFVTTDISSIIIFIILLLNINKLLSIWAVLLLFGLIIVSVCFKNNISKKTGKLYKHEERVNSNLIESLSSVDVIKGMHVEIPTIYKFKKKYRNFLSSLYSLSLTLEIISTIKSIIYNVFMVIILYYGSKYVIIKKFSLSNLVIFQNILNFYINSFNNLIKLINDYPKYKISLERVEDLFTIKKEVFNCSSYYKLCSLDGKIIYDNLSYTYNNKPLLKNVNLEINKGDKVFLYGPSGSGKSTLMKLLLRYVDVPFNHISINNIDINHYHLDLLREKITYVSQQEFLFNDTIYNNIKMYRECSKDEIDKVCSIALVDEIASYDKLVEENGFNFSGGERQRIIIARSILKNSDIYIFDEAFNEIDVAREKKILLNIFKYLSDKTIIVVSHRFDNKNLFDRTLTLKNGRIDEEKL